MTTFILLATSALVGSGILFRHRRIMTFLAAAVVLAQGQWLLLTALSRFMTPLAAPHLVFQIGSVCLLVTWLCCSRSWRFPHQLHIESGYRDLLVLAVTSIVLLAGWLIVSRNGFSGEAWVSHGFYNGDTATLAALVNRSFLTPGLVHNNPFAAGTPLEYPTLLHAGLADFFAALGIGMEWLYFVPVLTLVQIMATIPLFFLLFDTVFPEPSTPGNWFGIRSPGLVHLIATATIGYVLTLSWDTYVYPQSHFFLTGIFLFAVALLAQAYYTAGWRQLLPTGVAITLTGLLVLSNAIYGTAAAGLVLIFCACRVFDRKRPAPERATYSVVAVATVLFFLQWTPGNGSFGRVKFSYTAATDMIALAPALALLVPALLQRLVKHRFVVASTVGMFALAFLSFFFSKRNIVIDNASRFFYIGLLVSFPLLISILIQLYYWIKRELINTSHVLIEQLAGWGIVVMVACLVLFPGLASVASAHDHLMRQDTQVVSADERKALLTIALATPPEAVFITSPNEPFAVPLFTGRSVLRTDYWLSPDDSVLADVKAAFAGNKAAQERLTSQADYLFLTAADRAAWEPVVAAKLFESQDVVIYKLR